MLSFDIIRISTVLSQSSELKQSASLTLAFCATQPLQVQQDKLQRMGGISTAKLWWCDPLARS